MTANALHLPSKPNPLNALAALDTADNRNKIELIDVKCDKNENGMHVTIQFSESFDGIIYSQGFFNEPKCRYDKVLDSIGNFYIKLRAKFKYRAK